MNSPIDDSIRRLEAQIRNAKGHIEFGRVVIEYYRELLEKFMLRLVAINQLPINEASQIGGAVGHIHCIDKWQAGGAGAFGVKISAPAPSGTWSLIMVAFAPPSPLFPGWRAAVAHHARHISAPARKPNAN